MIVCIYMDIYFSIMSVSIFFHYVPAWYDGAAH